MRARLRVVGRAGSRRMGQVALAIVRRERVGRVTRRKQPSSPHVNKNNTLYEPFILITSTLEHSFPALQANQYGKSWSLAKSEKQRGYEIKSMVNLNHNCERKKIVSS